MLTNVSGQAGLCSIASHESRNGKPLDADQQLKGYLRSDSYRSARSELAREQAARQRQIRLEHAERLIDAELVRRFLAGCRAAFNARTRAVEEQFKARFPNASAEMLTWLREENDAALTLMSSDVLDVADQQFKQK